MSGAAFAVGNLLLARQMPVENYARLALAIAVFIVASHIATLGLSQLAMRRRLEPDRALLLRLLGQGVIAGIIGASLAGLAQGVDLDTVLLVGLIACGPLIWVISAAQLREGRKRHAWLTQTTPDWVLLGLGLAALLFPRWAQDWPLDTYCVIVAVHALVAWFAYRALPDATPVGPPVGWRMLLSTTAIVAGGVLVVQIERLTVGFLLDAQALAMFSVLASIAVFPFRLVTAGAGFVLVPGLQRIADAAGRRKLVVRELQVIVAVLVVTSAVLSVVGPPVAAWITAGRYQPSSWLVLAACLAGSAKVCHGLPRSIITACGTDRDLERLGPYVWLGITLSVVGGVLGAAAGLTGVLLGIAIGSIVGAIPAMRMAHRLIAVSAARGSGAPA